jgi:UrcA family protein
MSVVHHIVALGFLAAAATVANPALAADEAREVRYADLDLSTPTGVATLHRRINLAADSICGPKMTGPKLVALWSQCHAATVASASERVEIAIAAARSDNQQASVAATVVAAR